jgi:uncharacterized protein (DUF2062 family)
MIGILKMHQNMEPADDQPRKLFRNANGFDFQRLVEQALPSVVIGAIVVYANFRVLETQVASYAKRWRGRRRMYASRQPRNRTHRSD